VFEDKGEDYKVELIEAIPRWRGRQDLFSGRLVRPLPWPAHGLTGQIGTAFKLMKVAGAYWRGDSDNQMLTRIYGTAWPMRQGLNAYLHMLEEAEKRDHRKLGREMDLFHFQEEGPGTVFWHPKGWTLFQNLTSYMRRRIGKDYKEVNAPQVLDKSLWETSGHWGWYRRTCSGEIRRCASPIRTTRRPTSVSSRSSR
jgi:threonyl-tRNA synthetase